MLVRSNLFNLNPKVVCGIIVYNQVSWVGQCIEGMLSQSCGFSYTITIADDCSTDGTRNLLLEYQTRYPDIIQLVLNDCNCGIASNWVSCCRVMSGGEYVAFCDGDDYWSNPCKLQLQYDYMNIHPECVALSTDYDIVNTQGLLLKKNSRNNNPPHTGYVQNDLWYNAKAHNAWCSFMFNKPIFDKYIPFDAYIEYSFPFQDWPTLVVMAAYGEFHYLPVSTNTVRIGHESDSHAININKLESRMRRAKEMNRYLNSIFPTLDFSDDDYEMYINNVLMLSCIKNNNYILAKQYSKKSYKQGFNYWFCKSWMSFQILRLAKIIKRKLNILFELLKVFNN